MAADAHITIRLQRDLPDALGAAGSLNGRSAAAEGRLALQEHITQSANAPNVTNARWGRAPSMLRLRWSRSVGQRSATYTDGEHALALLRQTRAVARAQGADLRAPY